MIEKIKIAHLITSLSRGGRERQLSTIVANNHSDKFSDKIIYFNDSKNNYFDEYDIRKQAVKVNMKFFFPRIKELNKIFKEYKPDIVFTWGNLESIYTILLKPFHNYIFINGSVRHGIRSKNFFQYLRTILLHLSQYVVANSLSGLKANNLKRGYVLYNGISSKFLIPVQNKTKRKKDLINICDDLPVLISVANLVPYKDYFSILNALRKIKDESLNFYYIICGDGALRQIINEKITEFGLDENVKIIGHVQNISDYLKISDIFIHSSKGEGCSNAILEAMATGLPIIASDTGGTSEIVSDTEGLLFEFKNSDELAEKIKYLLKNEIAAKQMRENGLKKVREKFSIEQMMQNYQNIINQIWKKETNVKI